MSKSTAPVTPKSSLIVVRPSIVAVPAMKVLPLSVSIVNLSTREDLTINCSLVESMIRESVIFVWPVTSSSPLISQSSVIETVPA